MIGIEKKFESRETQTEEMYFEHIEKQETRRLKVDFSLCRKRLKMCEDKNAKLELEISERKGEISIDVVEFQELQVLFYFEYNSA